MSRRFSYDFIPFLFMILTGVEKYGDIYQRHYVFVFKYPVNLSGHFIIRFWWKACRSGEVSSSEVEHRGREYMHSNPRSVTPASYDCV